MQTHSSFLFSSFFSSVHVFRIYWWMSRGNLSRYIYMHLEYFQAQKRPLSDKGVGRDPNSTTITTDLWRSDVKFSKDAESGDIIGVDIE